MSLDIRPAQPSDVPNIAALLEEMDRFYGETEFEPDDVRQNQIHDALFGMVPAANLILAVDDDRSVGLASYSYLWPAAGVTRSLYLKELYVSQMARRRGVGRAIMATLSEIARSTGCSRVEWTTDSDNQGAVDFYRALGATVNDSKIFYRAVVAE